MTNRAEHLQWCKDRAMVYVNRGELREAMASMLSDLTKHPDTERSAPMGMMLMLVVNQNNREEVIDFINGFN